MMFIGHDSERYGYLQKNGLPMHPDFIARKCGCTLEEYGALLSELDRAAIPERTPDGTIFSRRMVRDAAAREQDNGRKPKKHSSFIPGNIQSISGAMSEDDKTKTRHLVVDIPKPKPQNQDLEGFDGEKWVTAILNAHPRTQFGQMEQSAVIDAIEAQARFESWNLTQAAEYVHERTKLYAACYKGRENAAKEPYAFYSKRTFRQPESAWQPLGGVNGKSKTQQRSEHNQRVAEEMLAGARNPGAVVDGDVEGNG